MHRESGFTLVESLLAIGIAAVGLLALIALLPAGMGGLRESHREMAEAKIIRSVVADYQMADWNDGELPPDRKFHFDERGMEVVAGSFEHRFTAEANLEADSPTIAGDFSSNAYLKRLTIVITDDIGGSGSVSQARRVRRHQTMLAFFDQTGVP
ncbi:MAG: Verru_Chthon cassette protein B [Verrucomicrobiales bacterium]|nr:Verru_Chthon cassette protein B [Verrucomicrobiales bacterium]